ncbi:MAG: ribosome assembly factor SBDS [Candidatus Micrarchaeota archaeon]|nr:ribosome assembly factor SBDS [Candidatus Micrarchaeota archaeon]MDE1823718.1 ribosome assembly factor SBDS [Candidatus Micrarchaeota archaeon]MDE1849192.1 ribosome assembly factor SBDS [Candidatus Micrarchaeota archaeon]
MSKTVIAKYSVGGDTFEIFVDSDMAYDYITGKRSDPMGPLQAEEVFVDANKGERASQDKIKKVFGTTDIAKIAETIMKKGTVPVTTEQKAKMMEEKRRQIVAIIARNSIDPRTNAPHPPQRIENAMHEAKVAVEPFKNANEQVESVLKKINVILPIKFATAKIEVTIPAEYANRCYGLLKQYGLRSEEWLSNGSLKANLEFPAGLQGEFFEKLNSFTKGSAIARNL